MRSLISGLLATLVIATSQTNADDWARFRGPNGSGVAADGDSAPVKWSPTENVAWSAELPGSGVSSPIVVGDRVFVTCYSGYGIDREDPGQMEDLKRHLVCFDAPDGKQVWEKTVEAVLPEDSYSGIGVTAHGYASHTPTSDGERIYVFFGKTGVLAFDLDGNQLWQTSVGTESDSRRWGSSSSPILHKDLLIVTASAESLSMVGLNKKTGEQVWKQEADGLEGMWGTPALVTRSDGEAELVMSVPFEIWGMNPDTGKLMWYCDASGADQANSSAVVDGSVVYAVTGRGGGSIAVRAGGKDDVSKSNILWSGSESTRFGSPLVHDGKIYIVANGVLTSIDAATGDKVAQVRLEGGKSPAVGGAERERGNREDGDRDLRESGGGGFGGGGFGGGRGFGGAQDYASPVVAGNKLYHLSGTGEMFVFELDDEPKQISVNRVTDESESFGGTPAISNGRLFLRSNKRIYCIAGQ